MIVICDERQPAWSTRLWFEDLNWNSFLLLCLVSNVEDDVMVMLRLVETALYMMESSYHIYLYSDVLGNALQWERQLEEG